MYHYSVSAQINRDHCINLMCFFLYIQNKNAKKVRPPTFVHLSYLFCVCVGGGSVRFPLLKLNFMICPLLSFSSLCLIPFYLFLNSLLPFIFSTFSFPSPFFIVSSSSSFPPLYSPFFPLFFLFLLLQFLSIEAQRRTYPLRFAREKHEATVPAKTSSLLSKYQITADALVHHR